MSSPSFHAVVALHIGRSWITVSCYYADGSKSKQDISKYDISIARVPATVYIDAKDEVHIGYEAEKKFTDERKESGSVIGKLFMKCGDILNSQVFDEHTELVAHNGETMNIQDLYLKVIEFCAEQVRNDTLCTMEPDKYASWKIPFGPPNETIETVQEDMRTELNTEVRKKSKKKKKDDVREGQPQENGVDSREEIFRIPQRSSKRAPSEYRREALLGIRWIIVLPDCITSKQQVKIVRKIFKPIMKKIGADGYTLARDSEAAAYFSLYQPRSDFISLPPTFEGVHLSHSDALLVVNFESTGASFACYSLAPGTSKLFQLYREYHALPPKAAQLMQKKSASPNNELQDFTMSNSESEGPSNKVLAQYFDWVIYEIEHEKKKITVGVNEPFKEIVIRYILLLGEERYTEKLQNWVTKKNTLESNEGLYVLLPNSPDSLIPVGAVLFGIDIQMEYLARLEHVEEYVDLSNTVV